MAASSSLASSLEAALVAQMVKSLLAMQETRVLSLGREDPLEEGMATQSGQRSLAGYIVHRAAKSQM